MSISINFLGFYTGFGPKDPLYKKVMQILPEYDDVVISTHPDYLFCSCFSDAWVDYDCIRIFYTGENLCPDFNSFDYAIGSDLISFNDRYLKYNHFNMYPEDCIKMTSKHLSAQTILHEDRDFCSFVVSKPSGKTASSAREDFFYRLNEYKKVNSGGRYLNNIGKPEGVEDKNEFQRHHKFSICFENSSHPGYSTEKIVQAFAAGTIPIYWGDPEIGTVFNEKSFVNCGKYTDFAEVVERVKEIDADDRLYYEMLAEPALNDLSFFEKQEQSLHDFLLHIVSQPYEEAYRRNRIINTLEPEVLIRKMRYDQRKITWRIWNKVDQMLSKEE